MATVSFIYVSVVEYKTHHFLVGSTTTLAASCTSRTPMEKHLPNSMYYLLFSLPDTKHVNGSRAHTRNISMSINITQPTRSSTQTPTKKFRSPFVRAPEEYNTKLLFNRTSVDIFYN